jgi:hypothetical protein
VYSIILKLTVDATAAGNEEVFRPTNWLARAILALSESSMYPSATAVLFQLPCLFMVVISAPCPASSVALLLRKQWPVYWIAFGNFKYAAILDGIFPKE